MDNYQIKIFKSHTHDPYENLAIENKLLMNIAEDQKFIFLYINSPCVVLGRFQNPFEECDLLKMRESSVKLVRRQSGGGTVYHDLHNLNYSFIHGTREHHKDINHLIILNALKSFSVIAEASGRSDLIVREGDGHRKFSGSAFKQKKDRAFHHGTLLIDSNLQKLNKYIKPRYNKIVSKSIKSNRSTVVNLSELSISINMSSLTDAIKNSFNDYYGSNTLVETTSDIDIDSDYLGLLKTDEWLYEETPKFELTLEVGGKLKEIEFPKKRILKTAKENRLI